MKVRFYWSRAVHDPILTHLVALKKTDAQIAHILHADVSNVLKQRVRLGLEANSPPVKEHRPHKETAPPLPADKPSPVAVAQLRLGTRLAVRDEGFWLDGRQVNLAAVMKETNRRLLAAGEPPVKGAPGWEVR